MELISERRAALLRHGQIEVVGRVAWSSNAALLVTLADDDDEMLAVYKPQRGERPLWDFPDGTLCLREVATCVLSDALGWDSSPRRSCATARTVSVRCSGLWITTRMSTTSPCWKLTPTRSFGLPSSMRSSTTPTVKADTVSWSARPIGSSASTTG